MSLVLLPLLATVTFSFKGGDDVALVNALSEHTKRPVALLAEPLRKWGKFEIGYPDWSPEELPKRLALRLGLETAQLKTLGLSHAEWPYGLYSWNDRQGFYRNLFETKTVPGDRVPLPPASVVSETKSGRVTVRTPDRAVPLSRLVPKGLKRSLSWHWFFDGAYLVARFEGVPEEEFVQILSRALGARLVERDGGDYLDLDIPTYRRRAVALLERLDREDENMAGLKLSFRYTAKVFRWLSDDQLRHVMSRVDHVVTFDAADNPELQRLALERVRAQYPVEDDGIERHQSAHVVGQEIKDKFLWKEPSQVVVYPTGTVASRFRGRDPKGGGLVI